MKAENSTRIQFDSLSSNEAYARGVTAAFLARYDPTVPQLADLKTAVSEAVTNCIVHAYPERSSGLPVVNKGCMACSTLGMPMPLSVMVMCTSRSG